MTDVDIDALMDAEIEMVERVPISAVSVRRAAGKRVSDDLFVVCSDGATYKRVLDGSWLEVEPVPGSPRALDMRDD